jgi:hypothetical protein
VTLLPALVAGLGLGFAGAIAGLLGGVMMCSFGHVTETQNSRRDPLVHLRGDGGESHSGPNTRDKSNNGETYSYSCTTTILSDTRHVWNCIELKSHQVGVPAFGQEAAW